MIGINYLRAEIRAGPFRDSTTITIMHPNNDRDCQFVAEIHVYFWNLIPKRYNALLSDNLSEI